MSKEKLVRSRAPKQNEIDQIWQFWAGKTKAMPWQGQAKAGKAKPWRIIVSGLGANGTKLS